MGKQVKLFDLLAKKQSLYVFKNKKKKNQLVKKLKAASDYKKQLENIMNSMSNDTTDKTVNQIKSESWYNLKLQDELIAIDNKIEFLKIEIENQGRQIAISSDKRRKFSEKKKLFDKLETENQENKMEAMIRETASSRSKF